MSAHIAGRVVVGSAAAARRRRAAGQEWLGWLATMLRAIETRRELARMDDRMLKDIGVSRADAEREATRAPWDVSTHRV
jgi:uncharacterized protein YjiS (DUF1127 family)